MSYGSDVTLNLFTGNGSKSWRTAHLLKVTISSLQSLECYKAGHPFVSLSHPLY